MRRSASEPDQPSGLGELLREGLMMTGAAMLRSPLVVGGATAFLVAQAFVTTNALWYQPHFHSGAFFETRAPERPAAEPLTKADTEPSPARLAEPVARTPAPALRLPESSAPAPQPAPAEREAAAAPASAGGDPKVREVQRILSGLNLYEGEVDGLNGPQTRQAVEQYRRIVGLEAGTQIDEALLGQLGLAPSRQASLTDDGPTASITPTPPRREPPAAEAPDSLVVKIQAGLRAFGNDGLELDGVVGATTRSAILEFQSLFGLPETGEPDEAVYAKMREIGLTD